MDAPEKIYIHPDIGGREFIKPWLKVRVNEESIEYTRTDAFIEKARKWFEQQPETYDANGVRCYGMEDFEDFKNYMKGE